MKLLDKYLGSMFGLAVGDALGTTLEFKKPGTFDPIEDMVGGGPFCLQPGQWTDDTSMALCLAESLIKNNGFDPKDQMERYCKWMDDGYLSSTGSMFDIGMTVSYALNDFKRTGEPYSGSSDPHTAGNGSLMRLAPVPLFFANHPWPVVDKYCRDSSRTTHGAKAAVDACRYFGGLIVGALLGKSKDEILVPWFSTDKKYWEENPLVEEIDEIASGSFKHREPPEIVGSGYVVRSLEVALWAFYKSKDFREGVLLAVNLGNDADTTGAIYGQLAGAYYGFDKIPKEWINKISHFDLIEQYAKDLYRKCGLT